MIKTIKADLHLHTCLSPCAEPEMVPTAIVEQAGRIGLDMIAICDHNSAENVSAVVKAGTREGLTVIGGIEITSREEVHILGLIGAEEPLMDLQHLIYENLPGENDAGAFGPQTVVDEWDREIGTNSRLLIGATSLTVEQIVEAIHERGGLAIASHVDRERFSLIGQLGFIPENLELDAVEVSPRATDRKGYDYPVVSSSDAHFLSDIGKSTTVFAVEYASFNEIRKALKRDGGRRIVAEEMEDLSLHILDIVENSIAASAGRIEIRINEDSANDLLTIEIVDDGRGMDSETLKKAIDPFFTTRTTRRVGLGLSFLAQSAQESDGTFDIESKPGKGTKVKATFVMSHPDCKPMGDIAQTIKTLVLGHPEIDFLYEHKRDDSTYRFDTREVGEK
jgi:predicted metal-dependent phosphoesterase TrpH/anti-sigma regulatory factor (Ser/Thr protein kinase)